MKHFALLILLFSSLAFAQEKLYQIKESDLTEQQKAKLQGTTPKDVHDWVGLGKEIGEAVNGSLSAVTTQANNFAQTPVGKLTAAVVIWKVLGQDALHFFGGVVELIIFVPIFIWSYRKMCMTRRIVQTSEGSFWNRKKTYQTIEYNPKTDFTPRHGHSMALAVFVIVWILTMFVY